MSHSRRTIAPRWTRFIARRWPPAARILARRDCGRNITPTITAPSCSIPTATISKRCAARRREAFCCACPYGQTKTFVRENRKTPFPGHVLLERRQHEDRDVDDEAREIAH